MSVVSEVWVTTTFEIFRFSVRLGDHNLYDEKDMKKSIDVKVKKSTKHDNFKPRTYENDVAILTLEKPVEFNGD